MKTRIRAAAIIVAIATITIGAYFGGRALAAPADLPGQPNGIPDSAMGTGTRFTVGNICLEDWTNGFLDDGLKHAATQWSRSSDINVAYRTDCAAAGYSTAQTITVVTVNQPTVSDCGWAIWWTKYGRYAINDPITRAVIQINKANTLCTSTLHYRKSLAVHEVGHELGLAHPWDEGPASVMIEGDRGWQFSQPQTADFVRLDRVYPW